MPRRAPPPLANRPRHQRLGAGSTTRVGNGTSCFGPHPGAPDRPAAHDRHRVRVVCVHRLLPGVPLVSRDRLLPEIIGLTATSLDAWRRCPRLYLDRYLLGVPPSDAGPSPDFGTFVHALLHRIHDTGSCADSAHVRDVLESHGADEGVIPSMVTRHAARCPSRHAVRARHEHELARFHRGAPQFLAAGRLDAIWQLDDVLEVRDYKTGAKATERVARSEEHTSELQSH